MEQISSKNNILSYILLSLLLAFTTFEYFFRYTILTFYLYLFALILYVLVRKYNITSKYIFGFWTLYCLIVFTQVIHGSEISSILGRIIEFIGTLVIAGIINRNFVKCYINIIVIISMYSLLFYILFYIEPAHNYLINELCPLFPSLNTGNITNEVSELGGGKNIIIYNFFSGYTNIKYNVLRNCGPFWEPGQFAVFLNLALFFNIFILKDSKIWSIKNVLILSSIITTFSSGGYTALFLILFLYILISKTNKSFKVLLILALINIIPILIGMDIFGGKVLTSYGNAASGINDGNRFAAFFIQLRMIMESPFIGGESIQSYTQFSSLASGILLPFVYWGIPIGLTFYCFIYVSFRRIIKLYKISNKISLYLFILVLVLAFPQTIITTRWFLLIIMVGLIRFESEIYKLNNK